MENDERIILLQGLGYFTVQHLYLEYIAIINMDLILFYSDEPLESMDENTLVASKELVEIARISYEKVDSLLRNLNYLHKDDEEFLNKILEAYEMLFTLGDLLYKSIVECINEEEDENHQNFLEYVEIVKYHFPRLTGIKF